MNLNQLLLKKASFSETLAQQRNKQSNLLRLNDVQLNSESDKLVLHSLGIAPEDEGKEVESNETTDN